MDAPDLELERLRRLAVGVGYRMRGSVAEAEDVAQEALLRLHAAGPAEVRNGRVACTSLVGMEIGVTEARA